MNNRKSFLWRFKNQNERPGQPIAKVFESHAQTDDVYFFDAGRFFQDYYSSLSSNNAKCNWLKKRIKIGLQQHPGTALNLKVIVYRVSLS